MCGSEVEHAVLLANFFTSMGKKAYVMLGSGVPEGDTAYVLTLEDNAQAWLWNSITGEHFISTETFCPLIEVCAIFNEGRSNHN